MLRKISTVHKNHACYSAWGIITWLALILADAPDQNRTPPLSQKVSSVGIVVLNWNGWQDTIECVESIQQSDYANIHIIIVDNHSEDESVTKLKERFPDLPLLETEQNLGYAGGNNVGIDHALCLNLDYVVILNNDTVIAPGCITALVRAGERQPDAGVIGCFIFTYQRPQEFLYAGIQAPRQCNIPQMGSYHRDDIRGALESGETVVVDSAHGCAFAIKAAALAHVRGFDPTFFAVHEEVDLCMRAREAGFDVVATPAARVYHKVGASFSKQSDNRVYYDVRNKARYFGNRAQAAGTCLPLQFWLRFALYGLGRATKLLLLREPALSRAVFWGTYDGVCGISGKRQVRR